jgi:CubicO group peptidase (beta-lactamase class C family)
MAKAASSTFGSFASPCDLFVQWRITAMNSSCLSTLLIRSISFLIMSTHVHFCTAQGTPPATDRPTPPSAMERSLIEKALLPLPTNVQAAIALVHGDSVRFLGAERTAGGIRYLDNRGAVFEIGSITKIFTATLLAQQVQKGTLRLDEPVRRLLPFELKTPQRGGVDVTLKHLASHTSGMRHQPPGIGIHALIHGHSKDPFWDYDQARFERFLQKEMKLDFTPGEKYQYSNMGMSLVGYVLSRKTGKSYDTLLQENIFDPLGMKSSSTDLSSVRSLVVTGILKEGEESPNWDMHALAPVGGIKTSAEDFARFAQAQFAPDAAIAMTQEPVFKIDDGYYVGLGWHIIDRKNGDRWLNHGGGMGGYTAIVNVNVKRKLAAIVLSNLGNGHKLAENVSELGRGLLRNLETLP